MQFYVFASLPFGLATAPYVFNKITRPLVKHWRAHGFRVFMFFDDGTAASSDLPQGVLMASCIRKDLYYSGFLTNVEKSFWSPQQQLEVLGYWVDLARDLFIGPKQRCDKVKALLTDLSEIRSVKVRKLAVLTGLLQSLRLAIGPVVRIWTGGLYRVIESRQSYEHHARINQEMRMEIAFWKDFSRAR